VQPLAQVVPHRKLFDARHGRGHQYNAFVKEDERRHADADSVEIAVLHVVARKNRLNILDQCVGKRFSRGADIRRVLRTVNPLSRRVEQSVGDFCAARVDSDDVSALHTVPSFALEMSFLSRLSIVAAKVSVNEKRYYYNNITFI